MGLEDFEKQLAEGKSREKRAEDGGRRHRHRDDKDRRDRHHHHHGSYRHENGRERRHRRSDGDDDEARHRHKRPHNRNREEENRERKHQKRHHIDSPTTEKRATEEKKVDSNDDDDDGEDDWVEKEKPEVKVQRDAWMEGPSASTSAISVDYVQRKRQQTPPGQFVAARERHDRSDDSKVHERQANQHLAELQRDFESDDDENNAGLMDDVEDDPAQHQVSYTIGDKGSSWRMTKLKGVYRKAEEAGKSVDDIAIESYGELRLFDDAREEERELDRRKMYGKDYVGLDKPSGELFQERKMATGIVRETGTHHDQGLPGTTQGQIIDEADPPMRTIPLDQTALNRLKAQMMKAKLRGASNAAQLEEEFTAAEAASLANNTQSDVIVLSNMENRQLAGDRSGEIKTLSGRRNLERGNVVENEDMSIEDMVKQEKRTRGIAGGDGRAFAERIAKDGKFKSDLDYMDDNANNLSKKVMKSEGSLRNAAVGDFQKMQMILENCPLCYHEESNTPPVAPVVSLATRTYMTLSTEPELAKHGAVIVPLQHRLNLLECDDDEWEEIRNFMKSLARFYHAQAKSVIFYENAAFMHSRKGHAALIAVPLPNHLAENASAYFKEAILASDEQWSQHKPVIDTLALAQKPGYGKQAFRKAMVKEMPYFHVFFTLDGGMGHVIEDERRWPKGDLFAREVIGGMLDKGPEVIKKQGRWDRHDHRLEKFRKPWDKFDWTKVLMEAQ